MPINESLPVFSAAGVTVVLCIGAFLLIVRPYWAFLFSVLVPVGLSIKTMVFSRFPGLGPYFNLYDASLLIAVAATTVEVLRGRTRWRLPGVSLAMMMVLIVGFINTTATFGFAYETLRALRWGLNVPLLIILGASMVTSQERLRQLLAVAFAGAVGAELQHLVLVVLGNSADVGTMQLRSTLFTLSRSESWLIAGPLLLSGRVWRPALQVFAGSVFLLANLSHQTRSIGIGIAGAMLVYYLWFAPARYRYRKLRYVVAVFAVTFIVAIPQLSLSDLASNYADRFRQALTAGQDDRSAEARRLAFHIETRDWMAGNLLIGRGLDYFHIYGAGVEGETQEAGFGHLGYITYLSQVGIFGFLVYALWFPLSVLLRARKLMLNVGATDTTRYAASLTIAAMLFSVISFVFSNHFLATHILIGVLAGAVHGLRTDAVVAPTVVRRASLGARLRRDLGTWGRIS